MSTRHVNLFQAYQLFLKNYFNFKGNSGRTEYWWAFFCNWLIRIGLLIWLLISHLQGNGSIEILASIILIIFCLAVLIPSISLTVRRYRNAGINVYWILLTYLLPYLLGLAVNESAGKTLPDLMVNNGGAFLEFICFICAVILPLFPTKSAK